MSSPFLTFFRLWFGSYVVCVGETTKPTDELLHSGNNVHAMRTINTCVCLSHTWVLWTTAMDRTPSLMHSMDMCVKPHLKEGFLCKIF